MPPPIPDDDHEDSSAMPPLPDVPYLIGIDEQWHAIRRALAVWAEQHGDDDTSRDTPRVRVGAECGTSVIVARRLGEFRRGTADVDIRAGNLCAHCGWSVALTQGTTTTELAAYTPTGRELAALHRLLPDPLLAVRICQAILAAAMSGDEYDADHPRWPHLLARASNHRPVVLIGEDCAEASCEHPADRDACYAESTTVACLTCSVTAGSWAGEWEGQIDILVPAGQCGVLPALEKQFCGREMTGGAAAQPR